MHIDRTYATIDGIPQEIIHTLVLNDRFNQVRNTRSVSPGNEASSGCSDTVPYQQSTDSNLSYMLFLDCIFTSQPRISYLVGICPLLL